MAFEELTVAAAAVTTTVSAAGIWRSLRASRQAAAQWHETMVRRTAELEVPVPQHSEPLTRSDR